MIKLVVEDVEVDVLQTERIVAEYSIAPIGNISKRTGARSISFSLPMTAKNRAVFEASEQATSLSVKPYRKLKARLYVDGIDMKMRFLTLESIKESYECRVYGSNTDLFSKIDKQLSELDLRAYNHHWTTENIVNSLNNIEGYIYPVIDWNSDSPNAYMPSTGNDVKAEVLQPFMFAKTIFAEIVKQAGYVWADSIDYRGKEEVVSVGATQWKRDKDGRKYNADFGMYQFLTQFQSTTDIGGGILPTPYGDTLGFVCTFEQEPFYEDLLYLPNINFQDEILVRVRGSFRLKSTTVGQPFLVQLGYSIATQTDPVLIQIATGVQNATYQDYTFDAELDIRQRLSFGSIQFGFYIITNGDTFDFDYTQTNFTIYDTVVQQERDIDFPPNNLKNYITIGNNLLGDKGTQKEFVSDYLKTHNALIYTDVGDKIVYTVPFSILKSRLSIAANWSGKLDFISNPKTEFDIGLAQQNTFNFTDDDTVIKPTGTDGVILIDNENLPLSKEYLSLKYAASINVERLGGESVTQIKIYENGIRSENVKPRILLLRRVSGSIDFIDLNVNNNETFTGDVPYTYFIDEFETYNMGFGNSLISDYFNTLFGVLDRTKVFECLIRLNASDIATFDFLTPVYIKELGAYFYVSKIKFDYTSNASSVVELVKLL